MITHYCHPQRRIIDKIIDSVIEGVEFHNIEGIRHEENIYEPAPGEISLGRDKIKKNDETTSCRNNFENFM